MEEKKTSGEDRLIIPKVFYRYDTGEPFSECMICQADLLSSGRPYVIEKSIKRYAELNATDIIYEYAICMPCAMEQKKAMSAESLQNIENYFSTNLPRDPGLPPEMTVEEHLNRCLLFGEPVQKMTEYVIQAACVGNKLSPMVPPYVIGEKAMHEISELISAKTRDEIDGFIDRYFSGPPEWRELLRSKKVVLL